MKHVCVHYCVTSHNVSVLLEKVLFVLRQTQHTHMYSTIHTNTHTHTHTHTHTLTQRDTHRQTDRQTDTHTQKHTRYLLLAAVSHQQSSQYNWVPASHWVVWVYFLTSYTWRQNDNTHIHTPYPQCSPLISKLTQLTTDTWPRTAGWCWFSCLQRKTTTMSH